MARIRTYPNDTVISPEDRLIGTDGGDGQAGSSGATRNFLISELTEYFAENIAGANYDTEILTVTGPSNLSTGTAYTLSNNNNMVMGILPSEPADGSWVRISTVGRTGVVLYAGAVTAPASPTSGNRFMAGVGSNGDPVTDPHILMVPNSFDASFELIYIANEITTSVGSGPVGWVIIN